MILRVGWVGCGLWACVFVGVTAMGSAAQPAPHAAHQPKYGGAIVTAASDTLHVEAVWSEQRRLRLFVSDASGSPLPTEVLREIEGSVMAGGRESSLALLELNGYFEARIPTLTLPASIIVRMKASSDSASEQLRFSFSDYSPELRGISTPSPAEIPDTLEGIVKALADDRRDVDTVIKQEDMPLLLVIEDRIRDRVLAVDPYVDRLPLDQQAHARAAITAVVRSCWLLHTALDYGTRPQLDAAVTQMGEALDRVFAAVSGLSQ